MRRGGRADPVARLKAYCLILFVCLSGCSWFHRGAPRPDPTELIVTGVAAGAVVFIDGAQVGPPMQGNSRTEVLEVAPGEHVLEVKMSDTVVYRENTYVGRGDKRVVTVLSGNSRD